MARSETKLTPLQQEVLDLMWETTTIAPVGRRKDLGNGKYELYKAERPTRPIDFPAEGFEREEFALKLHERRIDAPLSPYYINLRNMPNNLLIKVAEAIAEATTDVKVDFCTGIPQAGTPIALKYAEITGIRYREIFGKAPSESGRKIVAHPQALPGERARLLILDDLITEADTKFEAARVAGVPHVVEDVGECLGYEIAGIAVLADRLQGGSEQLRASGFDVFAPIPITWGFEHYLTTNSIDEGRYLRSMDYLNKERAKNNLPRLEPLKV